MHGKSKHSKESIFKSKSEKIKYLSLVLVLIQMENAWRNALTKEY